MHQQARKKKPVQPSVVWRMTRKTYGLYRAYLEVLGGTEEHSEQWELALDGLRTLKGFPAGYGGQGERAVLRVELIDAPTVSVH